jgi:hypothetical protein
MGCSQPLVGGGCVFKGGNESRHSWRVRLSDSVGNESPAAAAPRIDRAKHRELDDFGLNKALFAAA